MTTRLKLTTEFGNVAARAKRLALVNREIEAELRGIMLEDWEKKFCQWLAIRKNSGATRLPAISYQCEAATALAGTDISSADLKRLKLRTGWRNLWKRYCGELDRQVEEARAIYGELTVRAAEIYARKLDDIDEPGLEAARAAPPLLVPLLERAWPKKDENGAPVANQVNITLSVEQAKGLDAPPLLIQAEPVKDEHTGVDAEIVEE